MTDIIKRAEDVIQATRARPDTYVAYLIGIVNELVEELKWTQEQSQISTREYSPVVQEKIYELKQEIEALRNSYIEGRKVYDVESQAGMKEEIAWLKLEVEFHESAFTSLLKKFKNTEKELESTKNKMTRILDCR
jgi:hypothetical protein